jgi:F0F1-type ATP synthase membrane subunit c/vacuolar-type H+-ATPase subunit K
MIDEQELGKEMITLKIIFSAMVFSLAVYLFVGLAVVSNAKTSMDNDALGILRAVLYGMAFIILLITKPVRKFLLTRGGLGRRPVVSFKHPEVQKYALAMIVASAMTEGIGIFGLVLYILGKNVLDLYILIAVSAVVMIQYRPNKYEVIGLIEEGRMGPASGI